MKRREFLATSCLAGLVPLGSLTANAYGTAPNREYYELKRFLVDADAKREKLLAFLKDVAVPAWNRIGIKPVGVFEVMEKATDPSIFVLLPHANLESVATANTKLLQDRQFLQAGADFLNAPKKDPAYQRIESTLMVAFAGFPKLKVRNKKSTRIFELRVYESHNAIKAKKKIEMFNAGGEIAIFLRTGLTPVFFGETLIGDKIPNLTYMLVFDDMAGHDRDWQSFRVDPVWDKLRKDPQYKDTVSHITKTFLRPVPGSQI